MTKRTANILLTQNIEQATRLQPQLTQLGVTVVIQPTLAIRPVLPSSPITGHFDYLIFLSKQAVTYGLPHLPRPLHAIRAIAIGPTTAHYLKQQGFQNIITPHHASSEGLIELPEIQADKKKQFLIMHGKYPRPFLFEQLTRLGHDWQSYACYERVLPDGKPFALLQKCRDNEINMFVCCSNHALDNLLIMLGPVSEEYWQDKHVIVVSRRMAEYAVQQLPVLINRVIVANSSSDSDLLVAVGQVQ